MPLAVGTRIGAYQVVAAIGAGGMGEVYRAHDAKLNRDVAVKILPEIFATDADRVARLRREAQVLASLNHPNIGHIYGLEDTPAYALVMEFVDGPTLADMGRPALDQSLAIAKQIADALQAAHEHGVVHRDLKPSNIKVTPDGTVKVLDFGLAKAIDRDAGRPVTDSPTVTSAGTGMGVILGTAAYMSPEQARGRPVDKRTDIWAFGCVLYEMLTGRRAFEGDNVTDLLAGIVGRDPDLSALPASTPAPIRRLLRRCLEKDVKRRLSDIADARLEIEEAGAEAISQSGSRSGALAGRAPASNRWRLSWLTVVALVVAAAAIGASLYLWLRPQPVARPMRFVIAPPPSDPLYTESIGTQVAISPDGQDIVYVGVHGTLQLYARRVDQIDAQPIPGTLGARQPFFSPDGKSVGFWASAEGEIRKVAVSGGPVATICKAPSGNLYGASWGAGDVIVFGSGSLYRVSAAGGTPQVLTTPDSAQGEAEHRWPEILPDGRAVLFTAWGGTFDRTRVAVRSLVTEERKPLIEGATTARYSATGHLIYYQTGTLMASTFDIASLEVSGDRVPLQEPVKTTVSGAADFAIARNGTLVLIPGSAKPERKVVWVDRKGAVSPLLDVPDDYWLPRFSPDGSRLALGIGPDIWVIELARASRTRVTYGTTSTLFPYSWSRDGSRLLFSKVESKVGLDLYSGSADGSGQPELLLKGEYRQWATSVSSKADTIATYEQHPTTLRDIWLLAPDRTRTRFSVTPYQELAPRFSPNGEWIAYVSNDSGRYEIYVRSASGGGGRTTVSTEGGTEPVWLANGRELYYRNGDQLMLATIETTPSFSISRPRLLFESSFERDRGSGLGNANYDVSRDGQRFAMIQPPTASSQMIVVVNWFEELSSRVRAGRQ